MPHGPVGYFGLSMGTRVPRAELGGAAHFLRRRLSRDNNGSDNNSSDNTGRGGGGDPGDPIALLGVRYYVGRVPSPGDAR